MLVVRQGVVEPSLNGLPQRFKLYGICLKSPWPLPAPLCQPGETGLTEVELIESLGSSFAEMSPEAKLRQEPGYSYQYAAFKDGSIYLRWPDLFEFLISNDGARIQCRFLEAASRESFQTYLLNQTLSFALLKQGLEPLHCTALAVGGGAVGILGDSGYGKSTLAAAFLKAGHAILTDDLLVLRKVSQGFMVYPGPPRIKLFPEISKVFLGDKAAGTPMNPLTPKLVHPLGADLACPDPLPLKAIYVLRPPKPNYQGKRVTIRKMRPSRALLALVANTFNTIITEPQRLKRQYNLAAELTTIVPIKSLSYPRDLTRLPDVVNAIIQNMSK